MHHPRCLKGQFWKQPGKDDNRPRAEDMGRNGKTRKTWGGRTKKREIKKSQDGGQRVEQEAKKKKLRTRITIGIRNQTKGDKDEKEASGKAASGRRWERTTGTKIALNHDRQVKGAAREKKTKRGDQ